MCALRLIEISTSEFILEIKSPVSGTGKVQEAVATVVFFFPFSDFSHRTLPMTGTAHLLLIHS